MFRTYLKSSPRAGKNLFDHTCGRRPAVLLEDGALTTPQTSSVMELAELVDARIHHYRVVGSGRETVWSTLSTPGRSTDVVVQVSLDECQSLAFPGNPTRRELAALGPLLLAARLSAGAVVRSAGDDGATNLDPYVAFAEPGEALPLLAHYARIRENIVCLPSMKWPNGDLPREQFYRMFYTPVLIPNQARVLAICQSMSNASGDRTLVRLATTLQIRFGRALAGFDSLLAALSSPPDRLSPLGYMLDTSGDIARAEAAIDDVFINLTGTLDPLAAIHVHANIANPDRLNQPHDRSWYNRNVRDFFGAAAVNDLTAARSDISHLAKLRNTIHGAAPAVVPIHSTQPALANRAFGNPVFAGSSWGVTVTAESHYDHTFPADFASRFSIGRREAVIRAFSPAHETSHVVADPATLCYQSIRSTLRFINLFQHTLLTVPGTAGPNHVHAADRGLDPRDESLHWLRSLGSDATKTIAKQIERLTFLF